MLYVDVKDNEAMRDAMLDKSISMKAKAFLSYAFFLGTTREFSLKQIEEDMREGTAAMRSAMQSLKRAGYLEQSYTTETGKFEWNWYVTVPPEKKEKRS